MTLSSLAIHFALAVAGGVAGGVLGAIRLGGKDLGNDVAASLGVMLAPPAVVPGAIIALAILGLS